VTTALFLRGLRSVIVLLQGTEQKQISTGSCGYQQSFAAATVFCRKLENLKQHANDHEQQRTEVQRANHSRWSSFLAS